MPAAVIPLSLLLLPAAAAQTAASLAARRAQLQDAIDREWQHELET